MEFYSESQQKWTPGTVVRYFPSDNAYKLDCRPGPVRADRIRKAASTEARASSGKFVAGARVEYYSESQQKWIPAKVIRALPDHNAYQLDCQPFAPAGRVRKVGESDASSTEPVVSKTSLPEGVYAPGEAVLYYSESQRKWQPAKVLRYHATTQTYDLDIRRGAIAERVKRPGEFQQSLRRHQLPAWREESVEEDEEPPPPPPPEEPEEEELPPPPPPPEEKEAASFSVGDAVEYYSSSMQQWISTKVLKFHASDNTYDLECKLRVPASKIRKLARNSSAHAPVQTPGHAAQRGRGKRGSTREEEQYACRGGYDRHGYHRDVENFEKRLAGMRGGFGVSQ